MAESVNVKIKGLDELQKNLERLPKEVADKVLKESLSEGGNVVAAAMIRNSPVETGFLATHFNVKLSKKKEDIAASAFIGPTKANYPTRGGDRANRNNKSKGRTIWVASVARFLEFGTSKMGAKPFMRPAWDSVKDHVLEIIIDGIKSKLKRYQ